MPAAALNATRPKRYRPIIRVFVSSTFSDLKVERDALQRLVYPKLELLCLTEGFQFQAIDLRWGVPTEAGLDHRTMRICFEELRRSQEISPEPNFLILLGNRYGWRPIPEEITEAEYQNLEFSAGQLEESNVLKQWYRLDENSLTPIYILQPRRKPTDLNATDYTTPETWIRVEQALWKVINFAYPKTGLKDRFETPPVDGKLPSIVRFQASATEQEIWTGALSVPNAERHVRAFFRNITNRDSFQAEDVKDFFDLTDTRDFDEHAWSAQNELKQALATKLGEDAVFGMPDCQLRQQGDKLRIDMQDSELLAFCKQVESRLWQIIGLQIKEYWILQASSHVNNQPADQRSARELEIERDEHLRFGNERGSKDTFVGRSDSLVQIIDYVENDSQFPLVIHGNSGCGKSALLARAFQDIPASQNPVIRFIGVTPRSSDISPLLRSLCHELREHNSMADPLSSDVRELAQEFRKHLESATSERPVILFLDALDQLSDADSGRQLFWLPIGQLPIHVKIVVSCLSDRSMNDPVGQPFVSLQRRKLPTQSMMQLDALIFEEAKQLLFDRWLHYASRKVIDLQRKMIETKLEQVHACRQPLYLKLLFEEVKLWRSYNSPDEPGSSVPDLLEQLHKRLSSETNHGHLLVERVLGYLAAARRGLSETEILEVLFADKQDNETGTPGYKTHLEVASKNNNHTLTEEPPRIPIAIWARLRSDLQPYITERAAPGGNVLTFYHRQVAEWIKTRFVDEGTWNPHQRLADFFRDKDYFLESLEEQRARAGRLPPTPRPANIRKVDELPYHVLEVAKLADPESKKPELKEWDAVVDVLTDWQFLEAKAEAKP
jgi:hypothetical protein